jgi:hypothetical protein
MKYISTPVLYKSDENVLFSYNVISRVCTTEEYDAISARLKELAGSTSTSSSIRLIVHDTTVLTTQGIEIQELCGLKYIQHPVAINPDFSDNLLVSQLHTIAPRFNSNVYNKIYDNNLTWTTYTKYYEHANLQASNSNGTIADAYISRATSELDTNYMKRWYQSPYISTIYKGGSDAFLESNNIITFIDDGNGITSMHICSYPGGYNYQFPNLEAPRLNNLWDFSSATTLSDYAKVILGSATTIDPTNPYSQGGTSTGEQGGTGSFDKESEEVPSADLPSYSATESGFCSLYSPTLAQLKNLSSYMWSDAFDITKWKSIFANPIDAILGLSIVPVQPTISGSKEITIGSFETGVYANAVSNQYMNFDCGTLKIEEYWGSFMDYAPYTKSYIYLPYIGMRQLDTDEIMNKSVNVLYKIDLLSGACVSQIICDGSVLYQFAGQISAQIPVTSVSYNNMYRSLANLIATGVQFVGGMALGAATSGASTVAGQIATGVVQGALQTDTSVGEVVGNVMNLKPTVTRSGGINGACGILGNQIPYIILERPNQCVADNQNQYMGYPSNTTNTLGNLSGFTQVQNVHLQNLTATQEERDEIYALLHQGVII